MILLMTSVVVILFHTVMTYDNSLMLIQDTNTQSDRRTIQQRRNARQNNVPNCRRAEVVMNSHCNSLGGFKFPIDQRKTITIAAGPNNGCGSSFLLINCLSLVSFTQLKITSVQLECTMKRRMFGTAHRWNIPTVSGKYLLRLQTKKTFHSENIFIKMFNQ